MFVGFVQIIIIEMSSKFVFQAACKADHYIYDAGTNLCLKFHTRPTLNWTDAQEM